MPTYRIAEHWYTHTRPSGSAGHVWSIARTVLETIDTGPCLTPVPVRCHTSDRATVVLVPCGRRLPHIRQCANCAVHVQRVRISLHVTVVPNPSNPAVSR